MDTKKRFYIKANSSIFVMKYISHNEEYIIVCLIYLHLTQMISFKSSDELYNERCLIITIEHNHCLHKSKIPSKHSQKSWKRNGGELVWEISFYTIKIKQRVLSCCDSLLCIRTDKNPGETISKPSTSLLLTPLKPR